MQWPACFLICCWNEGMAGVNTAAQPQHKTLTYNYFHKFKGLIKLCVQLVKKGEKRRLNCEYIQCNKHRKPYHTHTWYKTNGRNHILEYETHKDAAAFKCVFCLTLRRLMSYIYGAPILDVSRSHTTTRHSR